jgi:hypothetical protein
MARCIVFGVLSDGQGILSYRFDDDSVTFAIEPIPTEACHCSRRVASTWRVLKVAVLAKQSPVRICLTPTQVKMQVLKNDFHVSGFSYPLSIAVKDQFGLQDDLLFSPPQFQGQRRYHRA